MLTRADVCYRMLTYAGAPSRSFPDHALQNAPGDRGAGGASPRLDTGHAGAQFTGFTSTKSTNTDAAAHLAVSGAPFRNPRRRGFFLIFLKKTFRNQKRRMRAVASRFVLLY